VRPDAEVSRDRLRIEVDEGGGGFALLPRVESDLSESGYGLLLVDRLSSRWGKVTSRA